jgi:hypothetical protein
VALCLRAQATSARAVSKCVELPRLRIQSFFLLLSASQSGWLSVLARPQLAEVSRKPGRQVSCIYRLHSHSRNHTRNSASLPAPRADVLERGIPVLHRRGGAGADLPVGLHRAVQHVPYPHLRRRSRYILPGAFLRDLIFVFVVAGQIHFETL